MIYFLTLVLGIYVAVIRFFLDDLEYQLDGLDPNITVLNWLRDVEGRSGTKEGCASGDCGACTVVVAEPRGEGLYYQAINACITPLGSLHGRQLLTVESLAEGEQLHPVQQAMADCHGSQCGFCTPGIIMSLFAHRKQHGAAQREQLLESLGGNLCRCTGYRPILAAGVQMYEPALEDRFTPAELQVREQLLAIAEQQPQAELRLGDTHYIAPTSLDELLEQLAEHPEARLVAGATDLALEMTQGLVEMPVLVSTCRVESLTRISEADGQLRIGAAATFSDCREILSHYWPDLQELIDRLGSLQIRNQGTLGGNIGNASPIGDMPPVLLALNATLELRSKAGLREMPLEDFFLGYRRTALQPGELITAVSIPLPQPQEWLQAYKISKRLEDDISAVCGVFWLAFAGDRITDARVAFGGMAEVPRRARSVESVLIGASWSQDVLSAAGRALSSDFSPISDMRASADYRLQVAINLLQRLYLARSGQANELRVSHYA